MNIDYVNEKLAKLGKKWKTTPAATLKKVVAFAIFMLDEMDQGTNIVFRNQLGHDKRLTPAMIPKVTLKTKKVYKPKYSAHNTTEKYVHASDDWRSTFCGKPLDTKWMIHSPPDAIDCPRCIKAATSMLEFNNKIKATPR